MKCLGWRKYLMGLGRFQQLPASELQKTQKCILWYCSENCNLLTLKVQASFFLWSDCNHYFVFAPAQSVSEGDI